ncbi:hypothetical protein I8746_10210 [Pseudomonas sp. USTB-Z]|uniref:hypothetical protein n=1 Tax=Pseudomonas sp. USTB-Z TaxID=2794351 RepID=UPI001C83737E|nr:hypothetical protein [Pseudomonas sp. USTB-Z]MBX6689977.1 hypothetical protein [Pseudomonas sp. USTB-Z]
MTASKPRNPVLSFKVSTFFSFPEVPEDYRAIVKIERSGLINTWLHDFRVAYTLTQAVQVATSLSHALIHLAKQRSTLEMKRKLDNRLACWSNLVAPYIPSPQPGGDQMFMSVSGDDFIAHGAFHDPDPVVEFDDAKEAIYDLSILLQNGVITMKFGWVAWILSPAEAEWLAEQIWTAALLAAKQAKVSS